MYQLSNDYDRLYELVCQGNEAVGFVDFKLSDDTRVMRDVCGIKRRGEYQICFGVRGTGYASVHPFMREDGSEKDVFVGACKSINLEWIETTGNTDQKKGK